MPKWMCTSVCLLSFLYPAGLLAQEPSPPSAHDKPNEDMIVWLSSDLSDLKSIADGKRWVITDVRFDGCLKAGKDKEGKPTTTASECKLNPTDRKEVAAAGRYRHDRNGNFSVVSHGDWGGSWYELKITPGYLSFDIRVEISELDKGGNPAGARECRTGVLVLCNKGRDRLEQGEPLEIFLDSALLQPGHKGLVFKGVVGSLQGELQNVDDVSKLCQENSVKVWYALKFYWKSVRDNCQRGAQGSRKE